MIENIINNNKLLSIIIYSSYASNGIEFFTPDDFSQQIGYMKRPSGYVISPHTHNLVKRDIFYTQEVLFIKSGVVRVDFYTDSKKYLESRILKSGDIVLLAYGGHGIQIIEQAEIIEVKQGPYAGEDDKVRFEQVPENEIKVKN